MRDVNNVSTGSLEDSGSDMFRFLEEIPTTGYLGFSFGSMLLSAFFFLIGRRDTALFLGQWVPSIGMFALVYKLLRPSYERPIQQMKETAGDMGRRAKSAAGNVGNSVGMS